MTASTASARFEFRLDPAAKQAITAAAAALGMDASDFARDVLLDKAEDVLDLHQRKTIVPVAFFEDLLNALDEPFQSNEAMERAQVRARSMIESDTFA